MITQTNPPLGNRRCIGVLLALLGLLWLVPGQAHAQNKSDILLVAPDTTYTPGRDITAYVFFFRLPAPFGFFQQSWGRYIRSTRDLQLTERKRLNGLREEMVDARGFPRERMSELFRIRLRPKGSGKTLTYGPLRLRFQEGARRFDIQSNALTFTRAKAPSKDKLQASVHVPPASHREGANLTLTYTVRCPQSLCDLKRLDRYQVIQRFQNEVRLNTSRDFWVKNPSVTPQLRYLDNANPPAVEVRFPYNVRPLRGGTLQTPPLTVPMPTIDTIDQHKVGQTIRKWAQQRGVKASRARRMTTLPNRYLFAVNTLPVTVASASVTVKASSACQGEWKLSSHLLDHAPSKKTLWRVRLRGKGFLLQADRYLRETVEKTLKQHNLLDNVRLQHYRWKLSDQSLNGAMVLDLYFAFRGEQVALPALSMTFLSPSNKTYTRTAPAISAQAKGQPSSVRLKANNDEHRIYIAYERPPSTIKAQPVQVWGYQLASEFPLPTFLSLRWNLPADFRLTPETKMGRVVRRQVQVTPFGRSEQVFAQGVRLNLMTGEARVRLRTGLFAKFPSVVWGSQRIHVRQVTSNDLSLETRTDRDSYFAGEPIVYDLLLHCPESVCTSQDKGFYAKAFNKHLTLPKFDKFSTWKKVEDFRRIASQQPGWVTLRTRVRFRAPSTDEVQLKGATLRFTRRMQILLYRQHGICLFTNQSREGVLKQAITKDHYNSQGNNARCSVGTRELSTDTMTLPIRTLPSAAKDIRLIGTFRIGARLTQLAYPVKRATTAHKPFYLLVTIEGDGDLQTAREQIRDQLDNLGGYFRKRSVTTYVELPDDKDMRKEGKTVVQLQLIPEEPTTLTIPSIKLKYYHREEGILTAQTLPFKVKVEAGTRRVNPVTPQPPPSKADKSPGDSNLLRETELRPNALLGSAGVTNQHFALLRWLPLVLLLGPFALFALFVGWHRMQLQRESDPQRTARQKALRQCNATLRQIRPDANDKWPREALDALQTYLIERLSLSQKQLTASEIERLLLPPLPNDKGPALVESLVAQYQQLEAALYGGASMQDPDALLREIETQLRTLDRLLPRS